MKRPKIGDIIEIPTRSGFAYAQFTHKHNLYGALLRVYNTIYQTKQALDAIQSVVNTLKPDFSIFFPIGRCREQKYRICGRKCANSRKTKAFPTI